MLCIMCNLIVGGKATPTKKLPLQFSWKSSPFCQTKVLVVYPEARLLTDFSSCLRGRQILFQFWIVAPDGRASARGHVVYSSVTWSGLVELDMHIDLLPTQTRFSAAFGCQVEFFNATHRRSVATVTFLESGQVSATDCTKPEWRHFGPIKA